MSPQSNRKKPKLIRMFSGLPDKQKLYVFAFFPKVLIIFILYCLLRLLKNEVHFPMGSYTSNVKCNYV